MVSEVSFVLCSPSIFKEQGERWAGEGTLTGAVGGEGGQGKRGEGSGGRLILLTFAHHICAMS